MHDVRRRARHVPSRQSGVGVGGVGRAATVACTRLYARGWYRARGCAPCVRLPILASVLGSVHRQVRRLYGAHDCGRSGQTRHPGGTWRPAGGSGRAAGGAAASAAAAVVTVALQHRGHAFERRGLQQQTRPKHSSCSVTACGGAATRVGRDLPVHRAAAAAAGAAGACEQLAAAALQVGQLPADARLGGGVRGLGLGVERRGGGVSGRRGGVVAAAAGAANHGPANIAAAAAAAAKTVPATPTAAGAAPAATKAVPGAAAAACPPWQILRQGRREGNRRERRGGRSGAHCCCERGRAAAAARSARRAEPHASHAAQAVKADGAATGVAADASHSHIRAATAAAAPMQLARHGAARRRGVAVVQAVVAPQAAVGVPLHRKAHVWRRRERRRLRGALARGGGHAPSRPAATACKARSGAPCGLFGIR
eukprot:36217-Chlamydomonas_euryale.AAC.1